MRKGNIGVRLVGGLLLRGMCLQMNMLYCSRYSSGLIIKMVKIPECQAGWDSEAQCSQNQTVDS